MPIHSRVCANCQENFETVTFKSSDEDEITCPKCGSKDIKKLPGYMSLYQIKGNNNASTPSKKRHKLTEEG